ncbi:hypothetical protein BGW39_003584 [Mortierella sp. 14UC]|nr:hypothetical protein BGW39_003584 [Mortierella sp. 14UC]
MHSVNVHQTTAHAVLIVHLRSIDPASVAQQLLHSHNSAEISFKHTSSSNHTTDTDSTASTTPTTTTTTVLVQPILHIPEQPSTTGLIQECVFSVSSENIVIRLKKAISCEWQALQLHFRTLSPGSSGASSSSLLPSEQVSIEQEAGVQPGRESVEVSSVLVKFVTVSNTTSFQEAIQRQPLWDQAGTCSQDIPRQVIGNVQAKRVPGMNAIQMTAELVPSSS